MKTLSFWKKSLYSAMIFFGTVTALTIGYSNYISSLPTRVGSGSGLTANEWNKIVTSLSDLDTNLSKLTFSGGNVGIWVSPVNKLDVNGTLGVTGPIKITDGNFGIIDSIQGSRASLSYSGGKLQIGLDSAGTDWIYFRGYVPSAGYADYMVIKNTGNVGIGTLSPWFKLDVAGGIRIDWRSICTANCYFVSGSSGFRWNDSSWVYNNVIMYDNGNMWVRGTVTANGVTLTSDRNLKKNVETLIGGLDKVLSIRGVTYNWKDTTKGTGSQVGVIAQEVEQVLPELVNTDDKGMKSVNYAGLVAPLIEAVKELSHKIDTLFVKYFDQQKEIDSLKTRLDALEQR